MAQTHNKLVAMILIEASKLPATRLFKRIGGKLRTPNGGMVQAALPGQADLYGWVAGHHIEIECKVGKDSLRPEQKAWRELCQKHGVAYHCAHAETDESIQAAALRAGAWMSSVQSLRGEQCN